MTQSKKSYTLSQLRQVRAGSVAKAVGTVSQREEARSFRSHYREGLWGSQWQWRAHFIQQAEEGGCGLCGLP